VRRVIAITGASAGIGRACAERLAADGAAIVVSARRTDRLADVAAAITRAGGRALAVRADVTSPDDMLSLVARAEEAFGRLDVMICNAGIGYHGRFDETPVDVMRKLVDVNLMGTLYAAQAALRAFRLHQTGHLIAISSIVGRRGIGGSSVYAATKAAQVGFIESLRAEFAGTPFRASLVLPVSTLTEFHETMRREYGFEVTRVGPRQSAATVAEAVARCITSPRAEVYPHRLSRGLAVLNVLAPSLTDRAVRRFTRRRRDT
jgi:NADP-dependent 3-hydroxy acid dehydrogenase YdfG